jgi:hypothetical protein
MLYFAIIIAILGYIIITKLHPKSTHLSILVMLIICVASMTSYVESFVSYEIPDEDAGDTSLGAKQEHLELAYRLCMYDPSSHCQDYIHHYDMLKSSHRRLKKGFCAKHPERCEKLGIL